MKPRVLFDVSQLGSFSGVGERGVRRVVENLAKGLLRESNVTVRFAGISTFDREKLAQALGPQSTALTSFSQTPELLDRLAFRFTRGGSSGIANLVRQTPGVRGILFRSARAVISQSQRIPQRAFGEADIYHSPFRPLPSPRQGPAHLRWFLTVYDLIPLLQPDLVAPESVRQVSAIARSIHPKAWLTCISEATKRAVAEVLRFPVEKIFVTRLAASKEIFYRVDGEEARQTRQRYAIGNFPYILSLSPIEQRKNLVHLLDSFELLLRQEKIRDLRLVVVGAYAAESPEFRDLTARHPAISDRVIFTGFVPNEDLAAIYSGAIAFGFPSLAEGFGLPPLAAMQCGVPVISSDVMSLPEVVGNAGFLLDPTDKEAWAEAMLRLVSDSDLRQELSRRSLARASEFTWERTVGELISAYKFSLAHDS